MCFNVSRTSDHNVVSLRIWFSAAWFVEFSNSTTTSSGTFYLCCAKKMLIRIQGRKNGGEWGVIKFYFIFSHVSCN